MNTIIRASIDRKIKNQATKILAETGLTPSDVIRIILTRIAKEKSFPDDFLRPSPSLQKSMREAEKIIQKKAKGFTSKKAFFEALQ